MKPKCDLDRLCCDIRRSRQILQNFREERREAVRQYVGNHWSTEGTREQIPVNLISLYVSIVGRNLIAKNPRVMLSIFDKSLKPAVSAMQTWANKEIERIELANTLQRVVLDALFSVGFVKVALATPGDAAMYGYGLKVGSPYACRVDLDDIVWDVHARDLSEASYIGHRYRMPREVFLESTLYTSARKDVPASRDDPYNPEGDERIGAMGRGMYAGDIEEYEDFVDLWEVYVPRKRVVLTFADSTLIGATPSRNGSASKALREQDWIGPECGPYHMLGYGTVPGNAMPKAPIQDLIDLHLATNRVYRKLVRQAERQKEVTTVQGGADADGNRQMEANDGDMVRVDRPEATKVVQFGGPNQQNFQFGVHLVDRFSWLGGNLDSLGGLSPQSKTAKQDAMLAENSSQSVADMQARTVDFTSTVLKGLCWYWWNHPELVMRSTDSLPGMPDISIQRHVRPQQRRAPFDDLDISVDPYSMQHATPQTRLAGLNQVVQQIVMPMMALLQQQGIQFDINAYLAKVASYMDMPDLGDIISIADPPTEDPGAPSGGGEEPTMPQETTRNYVRESRSSNTQAGKNVAAVNAMKPSSNGVHEPEAAYG